MSAVLVDTGILYAMADIDDDWHKRIKLFLKTTKDILIVPITVLPEICYLLNTHLGYEAERKLISSIFLSPLTLRLYPFWIGGVERDRTSICRYDRVPNYTTAPNGKINLPHSLVPFPFYRIEGRSL